MEFDYATALYPFNEEDIQTISQDHHTFSSFPVVYILLNERSKLAYIGETTNATTRMAAHLKHAEKRKLEKVLIISSKFLNKSAALDIESNLIQHIPYLGYKLLNANGGVSNHNYYQKEKYYQLFENIWDSLDLENTKTKSLLEIQNSDIFKYSPYKSLTQDQYSSIIEILKMLASPDTNSVLVDGAAGTGKTILAIYLIKLLSGFHRYNKDELEFENEEILAALSDLKERYPQGLKIGFVVPMTSLRKTLKKVFRQVYGLSSSMVIGPNDVTKKDYDLVVVDESHRLNRREGIVSYGPHDKINQKLGLSKEATQLDWMMNASKHQVLFYDSEQSIKPADVRKQDFDAYKKNANLVKLTSQLRSKGGRDYLKFVNDLLHCQLDKLTIFKSSEYELYLFDDMTQMLDRLQLKENEVGLSRLMSGYSWDWVSRKNSKPDAVIDGVELYWNKSKNDWINSTTDMTEMGCIHKVQGYDLNYAAVIFGEEISYDPGLNEIIVKKENYKDAKGKSGVRDENDLRDYIIKIYKTMMYRGIHGTFVYICDDNLRSYFSRYIENI